METLSFYLVFGYLTGSLPFAVIVSKAFGLDDPRRHGSGNPGATNVLRTGNKLAAVLTLLGDAAKGWVAMLIAAKVGAGGTAVPDASTFFAANPETLVALTGLAAFFGHLFPLFLKFKGGKGVATAIGVLIGLNGWLALGTALVWLATAAITRYSSLAAIVAAAAAPAIAYALLGATPPSQVVLVMCLLLVWRHKANIRRLLAGSESRIGKKA